jgi:hypothetical protein
MVKIACDQRHFTTATHAKKSMCCDVLLRQGILFAANTAGTFALAIREL